MEETLFWIGCGLGGYALFLRQIFKRDALLRHRGLLGFLHVLFTTAIGALIGFVVSASVDLNGPSPKWPILIGLAGFFYGIYQSTRTSSTSAGPTQLIGGDLELVETSFSAVLLASLIMYAVLQAFKIPSGSMENTLLIGDHLFVNKFLYGIRIPYTNERVFKVRDVHRGDVIVFQCPESALSQAEQMENIHKDFIKRCVGVPGDVIQVKNKELYVNGIEQAEPYAVHSDPFVYPPQPAEESPAQYQQTWENGNLAGRSWIRDNFGPVKVPPHCYFAMGDNRDASFDSRFWGPVPNRLLKGKAWFIYWPLNRIRIIR